MTPKTKAPSRANATAQMNDEQVSYTNMNNSAPLEAQQVADAGRSDPDGHHDLTSWSHSIGLSEDMPPFSAALVSARYRFRRTLAADLRPSACRRGQVILQLGWFVNMTERAAVYQRAWYISPYWHLVRANAVIGQRR